MPGGESCSPIKIVDSAGSPRQAKWSRWLLETRFVGMGETKTMSDKQKVAFGLTLPNRGVITGATTVAEMLEMAEWADSAGWDSVWVGDSIFAKPRLDAIALLGALAARTRRVRLGPACFASTPLRDPLILAYQWACLDFMSGGRTIFVACKGQPEVGGGNFEQEFATLRVDPKSRVRQMEEAIEIMRLTSSRESGCV
jgi:alkanesulfonate monooxygenase SsuD/methylene tetrahydromethanopterin reductase-like flavin-dependent oxidoreductase (luciferase family)